MPYEDLPSHGAVTHWATVFAGACLYFNSDCRTRADDLRMKWAMEGAARMMALGASGVIPLFKMTFGGAGPDGAECHATRAHVERHFGRAKTARWAASQSQKRAEVYNALWDELQRQVDACAAELRGIDRGEPRPGKGPILDHYALGTAAYRNAVDRCLDKHFPRLVTEVELMSDLIEFTREMRWRRSEWDARDAEEMRAAVNYFSEAAAYLDLRGVPAPPAPDQVTPDTAAGYADSVLAACDAVAARRRAAVAPATGGTPAGEAGQPVQAAPVPPVPADAEIPADKRLSPKMQADALGVPGGTDPVKRAKRVAKVRAAARAAGLPLRTVKVGTSEHVHADDWRVVAAWHKGGQAPPAPSAASDPGPSDAEVERAKAAARAGKAKRYRYRCDGCNDEVETATPVTRCPVCKSARIDPI